METHQTAEIVTVGDEIEVKVLKFDRERNRVSLGLKQLGDDPWAAITQRYPEGAKVKARITNLTDYGCFAEIETGVEGLVHVSEMDWTNKNIHPSKVVQLGDEVEVMILDIDEERAVVFPWVSNNAKKIPGMLSLSNLLKAIKSPAKLNPLLTSVFSSVLMVASTVWFTCLIFLGTKPAKKPCM